MQPRVFGILLLALLLAVNAGVVERQIESAIHFHRIIDQRFYLGRDQNIGPFKARRPAGFPNHRDRLLAPLHIAIADHDLCAFPSKRQRSCASGQTVDFTRYDFGRAYVHLRRLPPEREETLNKARGLLRALEMAEKQL